MQAGKVSLDQNSTPEETPVKMRTGYEEKDEKEEEQGFAIWDCGSPLYDSYELACITDLIESHMMVLPYSPDGTSKSITSKVFYPEEVNSKGSAKRSSMAAMGEFLFKGMRRKKETRQRKEKTKKMKTGLSGFLDTVGLGKK